MFDRIVYFSFPMQNIRTPQMFRHSKLPLLHLQTFLLHNDTPLSLGSINSVILNISRRFLYYTTSYDGTRLDIRIKKTRANLEELMPNLASSGFREDNWWHVSSRMDLHWIVSYSGDPVAFWSQQPVKNIQKLESTVVRSYIYNLEPIFQFQWEICAFIKRSCILC